MKPILSGEGLRELSRFASARVLLAFDFDGTLAPIVTSREHAVIPSATRQLLAKVTRAYSAIVISGRTEEDLAGRLWGAEWATVIGNHGMEPLRQLTELQIRVQLWHRKLHSKIPPLWGVELEDKKYSLAFHYRRSAVPHLAHAAILEAARELDDVRVIDGDHVVNFLPRGAPHKGIALMAARERLDFPCAIYIGDDAADEDVFTLRDQEWLLPIHIGQDSASSARFFLPSQSNLDELLSALLLLRMGGRSP